MSANMSQDDELKENIIHWMVELKKLNNQPFYVHCSNLLTKCKNTLNSLDKDKEDKKDISVFACSSDALRFLKPYIDYRDQIEKVIKNESYNHDERQNKLIDIFKNYKEIANSNNKKKTKGYYFTPQSKFESTIMEEFLGIFLSPIIKDMKNIKCGPSKSFLNTSFFVSLNNMSAIATKDTKTKDQDFSIYIEHNSGSNDGKTVDQIPLISIECKTYVDKTMLESSISTANRIKAGTPSSKFYIVTETIDLGCEQKVGNHEIDNIYVIRKSTRSENAVMCNQVFIDIYEKIDSDINSLKTHSSLKDKVKNLGRIKL